MNKEKILNIIKNVLIFIAIFIILWMTPLVGDDWGQPVNINIIKCFKMAIELWRTFNGRILGSIFVFFMGANKVIRIISETILVFISIYFLSRLGKRKNTNYLLVLLLFLSMSVRMFREVLAWQSGFWNFVIPTVCLVLYLYLTKNLFYKKDDEIIYSCFQNILCFFLGFFMNLFTEHNAIFSVVLGIGLIIVGYIVNKKVYKIQIVFLIGAVLGCIVMFASPTYWGSLSRLDNATEFTQLSFFGKMIYTFTKTSWLKNVLFDNIIFNFILSLMFFKNFKSKDWLYKICNLMLLMVSFYSLFYSLCDIKKIYVILLCGKTFKALMFIFYIISVIILLIKCFYKSDKKIFWWLFALFISSILSVAPLLVAYDIGPRCFYTEYIILISFLISLKEALDINFKKYNILFSGSVIFLFVFLFYNIYENYLCYVSRIKTLKNASVTNSEVVYLDNYPHTDYLHGYGNPGTPYHYNAFKKYYKLNDNIKIIIKMGENSQYEIYYES